MAAPEDDEKKIQTVPPPPGEEDAYNAPTKVGEVNNEAWAKLIAENEQPAEKAPPVSRPIAPLPPVDAAAEGPPLPEAPAEIPRLYNEDEEDEAATLLNRSIAPAVPAVETLSDADVQSESESHLRVAAPTSAPNPPPPLPAPPSSMGSLPPPMAPPQSPSRMLTDPIPYVPGKIDLLLRPQPGRRDYLPWVIGLAALIGFLTLTVGVVMTLR